MKKFLGSALAVSWPLILAFMPYGGYGFLLRAARGEERCLRASPAERVQRGCRRIGPGAYGQAWVADR